MALYSTTYIYKFLKNGVFKAAIERPFRIVKEIKDVRIIFPKGIKKFAYFGCIPLFIFWDPLMLILFKFRDLFFSLESWKFCIIYVLLHTYESLIFFAVYGICYGCDLFSKKIERKVVSSKKIFALILTKNFPFTILLVTSVLREFLLKNSPFFILAIIVVFPILTKILLRLSYALDNWADLGMYLYSSCLITIFSCFCYKLAFWRLDNLFLGIAAALVKPVYKLIIYLVVPWAREFRVRKEMRYAKNREEEGSIEVNPVMNNKVMFDAK